MIMLVNYYKYIQLTKKFIMTRIALKQIASLTLSLALIGSFIAPSFAVAEEGSLHALAQVLPTATLTINSTLVNDGGGTATLADFNTSVIMSDQSPVNFTNDV